MALSAAMDRIGNARKNYAADGMEMRGRGAEWSGNVKRHCDGCENSGRVVD